MDAPRSRHSAFTTGGALMALAALAEIGVGILAIAGRLPMPSGPGLIGALAVLGGSIFPLARLTMPNRLRAALILGLVVIALGIGVRSDMFGFRKIDEKIANATDTVEGVPRPIPTSTRDPDRKDAEPGRTAVAMRLRDGSAGSGGWAQRINDATDLTAPSGSQIAIAGTVVLVREPAGDHLNIAWTITQGGATEPCGVMTAFAAGPEIDLRALIATFRRAADRTAAQRKPACY